MRVPASLEGRRGSYDPARAGFCFSRYDFFAYLFLGIPLMCEYFFDVVIYLPISIYISSVWFVELISTLSFSPLVLGSRYKTWRFSFVFFGHDRGERILMCRCWYFRLGVLNAFVDMYLYRALDRYKCLYVLRVLKLVMM